MDLDLIVEHRDLATSACHGDSRRDAPHGNPETRLYRVRWIGLPAESDSWEPHKTLLEDILDVVKAYEAVVIVIADAGQPAMPLDLFPRSIIPTRYP